MNDAEIIKKWNTEKPVYEAWGRFIIDQVFCALSDQGFNIDHMIKIPVEPRLKADRQLIDKAFYRNKDYENPYDDIEDKVGIRFVVLLVREIAIIKKIVEDCDHWIISHDRDFEQERLDEPFLFTYQSEHYVLRPKAEIQYEGKVISERVACEVQIRTLLQHAYAELTHDNIYKAKKDVHPIIHRTTAKSMALIETTDGFFEDVYNELQSGPLKDYSIIPRLDAIYKNITGCQSHTQKSALVVWDAFEDLIDDKLIENISRTVSVISGVAETINQRYAQHGFYQQSTVLFVYWLLRRRRSNLKDNWPLSWELLELIATDVGVSLYG